MRLLETKFIDSGIETRNGAIDRAKALLIILVVIGHLVSSATPVPEGYKWYIQLRSAIYLFHMPAFLFLGGILFAASLTRRNFAERTKFIFQRADRLLIPFVFSAAIIVLAKEIASKYLYVANFSESSSIIEQITNNLFHVFVYTAESPARMIWYLMAYFLCVLIGTPFIKSVLGQVLLMAISLVIYIYRLPEILYLDFFSKHFVFFVFGALLYRRFGEEYIDVIRKVFHIAGFTFMILVFPALYYPDLREIFFLIIGVCGSVLIIGVSEFVDSPLLNYIGRRSMIIYLFNTLVIGFVLAIFRKYSMYEVLFPIYLITSFTLAIAVDVFIKDALFARIPIINRYLS